MPEIKILTPVGTSLIRNAGIEPKKIIKDLQMVKKVANIIDNYHLNRWVELEFNKRKNGDKDTSPAEMSSLFAFWEKEKIYLEGKTVEVVLIHSPGIGEECAKGVEKLLLSQNYFPNSGINWITRLKTLDLLDPIKPENFMKAMDQLADIVYQEIKNFEGDIFLNISGGYKALGPYLTMMALSLGNRVKVFYLYEDSTELVYLPTYPLSFSLLEWRDQRSLLFPFTVPDIVTENQKSTFYQALEGSRIKSLIQNLSPYNLNIIGRLMDKLYKTETGRDISEFGQGFLLLNLFQDKSYADYLKKYCIPRWRHLSVGDHIPQTVEHGRGHVQRLLELAQQLIYTISPDFSLSDEQLFVLICAIWLHDLGHTGDYFTFEGQHGLIRNKNNPASTGRHPVYGKPDEVRLYHSLLSYELLKNNREFLFPDIDKHIPLKRDLLLRSIQLACLFHRKVMPLRGKKAKDKEIWEITRGIKDFTENIEVIKGFAFVASLLRLLDGAENQQERTVSIDYYDVMCWVLDRQAKALEHLLEKKYNDRIEAEKKFKEIQKDHFLKHRWLQQVFIVRQPIDDLDPSGIYGQSDNTKLIIGVYMVTNPVAEGYKEEKVVKKIVNSFLEEFLLVKSSLPFCLTIILVIESNKKFTKKQVIVRNNETESEAWPYEVKII